MQRLFLRTCPVAGPYLLDGRSDVSAIPNAETSESGSRVLGARNERSS